MYIVNTFSDLTTSTKEKLKSRGYEISDSGVAVHTNKRLDREGYMDATQRWVHSFTRSEVALVWSGMFGVVRTSNLVIGVPVADRLPCYRGFVKALGAASFGKEDNKKEATSIFQVRYIRRSYSPLLTLHLQKRRKTWAESARDNIACEPDIYAKDLLLEIIKDSRAPLGEVMSVHAFVGRGAAKSCGRWAQKKCVCVMSGAGLEAKVG